MTQMLEAPAVRPVETYDYAGVTVTLRLIDDVARAHRYEAVVIQISRPSPGTSLGEVLARRPWPSQLRSAVREKLDRRTLTHVQGNRPSGYARSFAESGVIVVVEERSMAQPGQRYEARIVARQSVATPGRVGDVLATGRTASIVANLAKVKISGWLAQAKTYAAPQRRTSQTPDLILSAGGAAVESLDLLGEAGDWRERALCTQSDPEAFYPERGNSSGPAKAVCGQCEVTAECLIVALEQHDAHGVWGGATYRERCAMQKRNPNIAADLRRQHGLPAAASPVEFAEAV